MRISVKWKKRDKRQDGTKGKNSYILVDVKIGRKINKTILLMRVIVMVMVMMMKLKIMIVIRLST